MDGSDGKQDIIFEEFRSGENLIISSQKIRKIYEKMWIRTRKTYGLTQNEIDVLLFLKRHPAMDTAVDIASCCSLSRSLVCKSVENLLKKNYLAVHTDPHDRRYLHLELTQEAKKVLTELAELGDEFWTILQKGIKEDEMDMFLKVLKKMRNNLESIVPDKMVKK